MTMLKPYPMKLRPVLKNALWGGTKLSDDWYKAPVGEPVAESWELTVREKERNCIANGETAGRTLNDVLEEMPAWIGSRHCGERFPLLIKFIDAEQTLSVQVHPDDDYAARVEHDSGKNEMWYIVDAAPDSEIVYGLRDGVSAEDFRLAVSEDRIRDVLRFQRVQAGECYYIPAGLVHAIGAGILIAEIQQNSDLTYRVYDYDRLGADGKPRELHREKACDVVVPMSDGEMARKRYAVVEEGESSCLAHSIYFGVRKCQISALREVSMHVGEESFVHLLFLAGDAEIVYADGSIFVARGDSIFLPAGLGACAVRGEAEWLETRL